MAYKMYITDALVCGSHFHRTSDRSYLLFTREAGMVLAVAKSVREERSKQRYALQEFSLARVTLVRGRDMWKIAGVEPVENFYFTSKDRDTRAFIRSVIQLLRRVMHGEVEQRELFDDVLSFLQAPFDIDRDVLLAIVTLRILNTLGYVAPDAELAPICRKENTSNDFSEIVEATRARMMKVQSTIDSALAHSHL